MNNINIFKTNKFSISLLSCLALTAIKTHANPNETIPYSIVSDGTDVNITVNQKNILGYFHSKQLKPEDELKNKKFSCYNSNIFSIHPDAAINLVDTSIDIQNTQIKNNTGAGITIIKNHSDVDEFFSPDAIINKARITAGNSHGISNIRSHISINNTTIDAGKENEDNSLSLGLEITSAEIEEDEKTTITDFKNSAINSYGDGILIRGGETHISNSIINAGGYSGIIIEGGNLTIDKGTKITATNNAYGIFITDGRTGTYANNNITIDNAFINTGNSTGILVNRKDEVINPNNIVNIKLQNNTQLTTGNGDILQAWKDFVVNLSIDNSNLSGRISAHEESSVDIKLSGNSHFSGDTKNVHAFAIEKNASWEMTSNSDIADLYNAGNIVLSKKNDAAMELLVNNEYTGQNGSITFNSTLVGDNLLSDKLIIQGNSSGLTNVSINNIGGTDSAFLNGLEFIHIDGLSDGVFNQSGRIVAGAYDYALVRGHGNNDGNWYLTNQQSPRTTADNRIERPEAASYIANLSAANTLFTTTLSDRLGETQFTDAQTGEKKVTSLWLRQVGSHNNWRDSNDQLKTQSNSYVTQLGGDIAQLSKKGHNRGHLGLMAGYGTNRSNSRSSVTDYHSKGSVKGYSVGTYGTWFANNAHRSGLYVDGWLQYNWFNNHVQGQRLSGENYKSKGLNAAVETGYTIKIGEFIKSQGIVDQWFIQPQAQVTRMGVKAKNHREANGTRVASGGEGNIQTRLGIKTYLKGQHAMDKDKNREFEPFIEVNWLHNTRSFSATMDGDSVTQAGTRNIGEAKIGVAGKINSKVNLWGNIGVQVADNGYNNTSAMVGVKYHF